MGYQGRSPWLVGPAMRRPSLLISAGEELFASFFSRQEQQRLSRLFRWERRGTSKFTADFRQCLSTTQALVTTWDSLISATTYRF
jgi:hypothetical protein